MQNDDIYIIDKNKADLIKKLIENCTKNLYQIIKYYTGVNEPVEIITNSLSEVIHAHCHDTLCAGTAGGGWDHIDKGEDKNTSHVQSYVCPDCEKKVVFFATKCPLCGSLKRGKIPHDGRWGISAETHFKWLKELKEYRLQLVEPVNDDANCREFRIRYWVIPKDSKHLNLYAKHQYKSEKSNNINFQPLSKDFYLSKPIKKFDGILRINENDTQFDFLYFNMDNSTPEKIPNKLAGFDSETVIKSKKFGKERGTWIRK